MRLLRFAGPLALSLGLLAPIVAQNAADTAASKKQLKADENAEKQQSKADKAQRKALGTKQQKKADKAQDKANAEAVKAASPQQ